MKKKQISLIFTVFGFLIMVVVALLCITEKQSDEFVSAIPSSLFGLALFMGGWITYAKTDDKSHIC